MQKKIKIMRKFKNYKEAFNCILNYWLEEALPYFTSYQLKNQSKYRRIVIKENSAKPHFFKKVNFMSEKGVRFTMIPYSISKSDFKKRGLCFIYYICFILHGHKHYAYLANNCAKPLNFKFLYFTKHSIERYIERFKGAMNLDITEDLIIEIIKRNSTHRIELVDTPDGLKLYSFTDDGIFAVKKYHNLGYKATTFLSKDMFYKNQKELYNKNKKLIDRYRKDNFKLDYGKLAS